MGFAVPSAAASDEAFNRCKACHEIRKGDEVLVKGGRNGPNLYGVIGRRAGSLDGYRYSQGLVDAGEAGLVFDEAALAAFARNPNAMLSDYMGRNARSKMPFGIREGANEVASYLATFSAE